MRVLQPTAVAAQPLLLQLALAGKAFGGGFGIAPPQPAGEVPWIELQNPASSGVLVTIYGLTAALQFADVVEFQTSSTQVLPTGIPGLNVLAGGPGSKALTSAGPHANTLGITLGGVMVAPYSLSNLVGQIQFAVVPPGQNFQIVVFNPDNFGEVGLWWTET